MLRHPSCRAAYYVLPDTSLEKFESAAWVDALGNLTVVERNASAHVTYDSAVSGSCHGERAGAALPVLIYAFLFSPADGDCVFGCVRQQHRPATTVACVEPRAVLYRWAARWLHAADM